MSFVLSKSLKLTDTIYYKANAYILYVETLLFLVLSALSLSHIARYAPSFQNGNTSKTTKFYTIHQFCRLTEKMRMSFLMRYLS